jgi:ABC-type Fe3+/spermidine/putrescine transport system ATPase subunit
MSGDEALACSGVEVTLGATRVLDSVDLEVDAGETVAVLGPSGAGKTTLLYAIAGFTPPRAGQIRVAGRLVDGPGHHVPPERRGVGVVFQHYALWPHLTALETAAYPLRRAGAARRQAEARALALLELMGVGHLAARRPAELSGGEQQRVGVARALARGGQLLLLDEPTAHLDAGLRAALMAEVAQQRARAGAAAIYATHDVGEALAVADRVALLREGRIVQVGTPQDIYERPLDLWAARLSGPASILTIGADPSPGSGSGAAGGADAGLAIGGHPIGPVLDGVPADGGGALQILVRPDWASLGGDLPGRVLAAWYRGPHTDYRLATPAGDLEIREEGPPRAAAGDEVRWGLVRGWVLG